MSAALDTRIRTVLLRMLRYQEASAVDYDRPVLHRLKASSSAPVDTDPLVLQWARRFERMVEAAERDAERFERGERMPASNDRRSDAYKAANKRVLAKENLGVDPTWIAFWECRTTKNIQDLRANAGLDPMDGTPRPKPFTNIDPPPSMFDQFPSAQARPTSTNVMRRERPGQRKAPESEAARACSRSTTLGGLAPQLGIDECIDLAERECFDPPCPSHASCDYAGECLCLARPQERP